MSIHIIVWNPEKSVYSMQKHKENFARDKFIKHIFIPELNCMKAGLHDKWILVQTGSPDGKQNGIAGWGRFEKKDGKNVPSILSLIDRGEENFLSSKDIKDNVPGIEWNTDAGESGLSSYTMDREDAEPLIIYILTKLMGRKEKGMSFFGSDGINCLLGECYKAYEIARKEDRIRCFHCDNEIQRKKYDEFLPSTAFEYPDDSYDPETATAEDFFKLVYVEDLCEDCRKKYNFPESIGDVTEEQWGEVGIEWRKE